MRSRAEISFRLQQEAANLCLFFRNPLIGEAPPPSPLQGLPNPSAIASQLRGTAFASEIERLANEVLEHRFPLLGYTVETGPAIDWRRDYVHQKTSPPSYFRFIPYLDFAEVGDHKVIWELNRHQHLVLLAQAFCLTKQEKYLRRIHGDLETWFEANPFGRGINWTSALEVSFRALSWTWVYHLTGGSLEPALRQRLLTGLYRHGCYLERNLSVFFSPNTHLLGEAVALHALGVLFPQFPRARIWQETGGALTIQQMARQVREDGSHFEQSSYYHVYALDMLLWHFLLAKTPPTFAEQLIRMAEYLDALMGPQQTLPFLGDDDGGRCFHPYGPRERFGRATLATSAVLFNRPDWIHNSEDFYEQGMWWMGDRPSRSPAPTPRKQAASRFFPQAGIAVMEVGDVHIVADAGTYGYGSAGHSHSDTLSCVIRRGSEEILVDAGTFTYLSDRRWRDWFRGSAAHNTLRVDGKDQATPDGPFRWFGRPQVGNVVWRCLPESDLLDASCAYAGFTHRRRILFLKPDLLIIVDEVNGPPGEHLIEQFWHPGTKDSICRLRLSEQALLEEGGEHGWRSTVHGHRNPTPVLRVTMCAALPAVLAAVVDLALVPSVEMVTVVRDGSEWMIRLSGAQTANIYFGSDSNSLPRIEWNSVTPTGLD